MSTMPMSMEVQKILGAELESGERLLWSGMPQQGLVLQASDAFMIPFSLMWGGFAVFWEYSVVTATNAPLIMQLWGIPFVLVGLYMIVGRFFADSYRRAHTYYGLTEERALIVSGVFSRQVRAIGLPGLSEVAMDERSNGRGNIRFGPAPYGPYGAWGNSSWPNSASRMAPTFELIERVRQVYDLIRTNRR